MIVRAAGSVCLPTKDACWHAPSRRARRPSSRPEVGIPVPTGPRCDGSGRPGGRPSRTTPARPANHPRRCRKEARLVGQPQAGRVIPVGDIVPDGAQVRLGGVDIVERPDDLSEDSTDLGEGGGASEPLGQRDGVVPDPVAARQSPVSTSCCRWATRDGEMPALLGWGHQRERLLGQREPVDRQVEDASAGGGRPRAARLGEAGPPAPPGGSAGRPRAARRAADRPRRQRRRRPGGSPRRGTGRSR